MNRKTGIYASIITFIAVAVFALCMLFGAILNNDSPGKAGSYFSSICIALGFVSMVCAYISYMPSENKAVGLIALSFSIMYCVTIIIVYFTQLTTLRLQVLSEEAKALLDYSEFGLFFNYDLLGYAFMALATFFTGVKLETKSRNEKILKYLLCIHGIFAVSCFVMPILGVFSADMAGGNIIGTIVLEFWCIYFMPICLLSYGYFKNR
ncbi:hypothetical protein K7I13_09270 [Brucepastera parasyntrophica]|uniref:hypothetical protein n=1 Tax=Brucepastera parasyntrophica TaxID=2880008 RepID=UPI00210E7D76|nr:hypothetical protein [Brucepastera parasyntrophica]ULQ58740.1 hypothetical protein K7I13_09270 [Brucepastera parasyntrophica]